MSRRVTCSQVQRLGCGHLWVTALPQRPVAQLCHPVAPHVDAVLLPLLSGSGQLRTLWPVRIGLELVSREDGVKGQEEPGWATGPCRAFPLSPVP